MGAHLVGAGHHDGSEARSAGAPFPVESYGERVINILDDLQAFVQDEERQHQFAVAVLADAGAGVAGVERLRGALRRRVVLLLERAAQLGLGIEARCETFWLDDVGLIALAETGTAGRKIAHDSRPEAEESWGTALAENDADLAVAWWTRRPEPEWYGEPPFLRFMAAALWQDVVLPKLRSPLSEVPAVSAAVLVGAQGALWRRDRTVLHSPEGEVVISGGRRAARLRSPTGATLLAEDLVLGLRASRTLAGHRLVRWIVARAYQQHAEGRLDPRRIRVEGGLLRLAQLLGIRSDKETGHLREALEFGQCVEFEFPGNISFGGLWTWSLRPPRRGVPSRLSIVVGDPLLPSFVNALPKGSASMTEARRLVPFPEVLPPFIGHPSLFAPQSLLQLLVLREMRFRAEEYVATSGILIPKSRWGDLAEEAELPVDRVEEVVHVWSTGDGTRDRFLVQVEADLFRLSPTYAGCEGLLKHAAGVSADARRAQRASIRARRARRAREQ